ncbi:MAG: hypothetical protein RIQ93_432 [Verrucomicrobiota bacterium]|jgi:hypothetical protein
MRDQRIEVLVLRNDREFGAGKLDCPPAEMRGEYQIQRVAARGADLDQPDLPRQTKNLADQRDFESPLFFAEQQRHVDRFTLDRSKVDGRYVLEVDKDKPGEGSRSGHGRKAGR